MVLMPTARASDRLKLAPLSSSTTPPFSSSVSNSAKLGCSIFTPAWLANKSRCSSSRRRASRARTVSPSASLTLNHCPSLIDARTSAVLATVRAWATGIGRVCPSSSGCLRSMRRWTNSTSPMASFTPSLSCCRLSSQRFRSLGSLVTTSKICWRRAGSSSPAGCSESSRLAVVADICFHSSESWPYFSSTNWALSYQAPWRNSAILGGAGWWCRAALIISAAWRLAAAVFILPSSVSIMRWTILSARALSRSVLVATCWHSWARSVSPA